MMFRLRRMGIDTQSEHVIFIREDAVKEGLLGFKPLDRVLACALRHLDDQEIADFTMSMVETGSSIHFDSEIVADKHCIGGVPGNRTTMIVVPILVALGLTVPKTSSKAITSAAGTADTMSVMAEVALSTSDLHRVVDQVGGCIAWGGALDLAPADDVLITVERPMQIDTEAQMVASILAKKKTAGATHTLIDIPVGPSTKIHSRLEAEELAGRILERTGVAPDACGYRVAMEALDSGRAARSFEAMVAAQGALDFPDAAAFQSIVESKYDGRIQSVDCLGVNRMAKLAGSPAHPAAGLRSLRKVGDVVGKNEPLFEIHAQSRAQLEMATGYAKDALSKIVTFGY